MLTVLGNKIWTFNTSDHVVGFQYTNDILHGHRTVRPSTDFGSCDRITSVRFHFTRGIGMRVLLYNGWNKSSHHNGFITSKCHDYILCTVVTCRYK